MSTLCSLDGKYDLDTVECALLVEISGALFQAVRPFAVNEVEPLNLGTVCASLENCHRHWLCLCCPGRQHQSVFKMSILVSLCARGCCTASRGEPGGVGVGVSLEAWGKEKQKSGFEDGSKS